MVNSKVLLTIIITHEIVIVGTQTTIKRLRAEVSNLKKRLVTKNLLMKALRVKIIRLQEKSTDKNLCRKDGRGWTKESIIKAVSLRAVSLKGYETVRRQWKVNIPAPRTIRSHLQNFPCAPGIIDEVIQALRIKCEKMDIYSKLCGILFDEMSLDSRFTYDKYLDKVYSSSKSQVLMVRGICSDWKQPIYFDYDCPMTKAKLLQLIQTVEEIGFTVVCVTSDFGADNQALWKSMDINHESISFHSPLHHDRPVFVFADVPHMLKLIRNHLLDDGVILEGGTEINMQTLDKLIELNGEERKLCPNLTPRLVQVTQAERMKVMNYQCVCITGQQLKMLLILKI